eukprot:g8286.t1
MVIVLTESNAQFVTIAVVTLNLLFYTAYSKEDKNLQLKLLLDVLLIRKGIGHTLNELNKIIALSGLTLAAISFLPIHLFNSKTNLLWNCLYTQIFHAAFSTYKYYGDKNMPEIMSWLSVTDDFKSKSKKQQNVGAKKLSNILSVAAFALLVGIVLNYYNMRNSDFICFLMLLLSVCHFYFMEIDFKYVLKVRPYGLVVSKFYIV